jgi:hypothetical protein
MIVVTSGSLSVIHCSNGRLRFLYRVLPRSLLNIADLSHRMGELEPWIDENFVRSVWFGMGEQVNVKMIRDKFSG